MPLRYVIGLIVVTLGVGVLLDQFYPGLNLVARYWPALLIAAGLNALIRQPRSPWWPLVLLVSGTLLLARTLTDLPLNPWAVIGAALLIGIGLQLLLPRREPRVTVGRETTMVRNEDRVNQAVAFGGAKIQVTAQRFSGGRVSATFGGVELDLRGANLSPAGADLALDATFGGIQVYIPVGWPLIVRGAPAFGGCEAHVANTEIAPIGGCALRITAHGAFGGVEIKN